MSLKDKFIKNVTHVAANMSQIHPGEMSVVPQLERIV